MKPDFSIESEGIDSAALAEELARRVGERRAAGVYTHQVEAMLAERLPEEGDAASLSPVCALDYAATRTSASWEVTSAYPVETEKRFLRPLIIFVKRLARAWARVAVGPIQREQTAFNRHAASALEALRRQAVAERAAALAAESDLCSLASSMVCPEEAAAVESAVAEALGDAGAVTVLGPCRAELVEALSGHGLTVLRVSAGTSWDDAPGAATGSAPLAFLSQVQEGSVGAILVCELSFWLKPDALVGLARDSYLALCEQGRIVLAVHGFASGPPAPAWCAPEVVESALLLAGFHGISVKPIDPAGAGGAPGGFVAGARKR